jgi:hypothetical protein
VRHSLRGLIQLLLLLGNILFPQLRHLIVIRFLDLKLLLFLDALALFPLLRQRDGECLMLGGNGGFLSLQLHLRLKLMDAGGGLTRFKAKRESVRVHLRCLSTFYPRRELVLNGHKLVFGKLATANPKVQDAVGDIIEVPNINPICVD